MNRLFGLLISASMLAASLWTFSLLLPLWMRSRGWRRILIMLWLWPLAVLLNQAAKSKRYSHTFLRSTE